MVDKHSVDVGNVLKIERTEKGWKVTTEGAGNAVFGGKPFHHFPTFDEAVAYLKSSFQTD